MEILEIPIFIGLLGNFLLGILVLAKNRRGHINRAFFIFALLTTFWILPNFLAGIFPSPIWVKMGYGIGVLVPLSALEWIASICEVEIKKLIKYFLIFIGLLLSFLAWVSNFIIGNITRVYLGGFEGKIGSLFNLYWLYITAILVFIIYILSSQYTKSKGVKKLQITYILLGAGIYIFIVVMVDFILPLFGIKTFIPLDSPSSLFFVFFTALAITRYHLFGIEVILTELMVGVIGILLIVQIFMAPALWWKIVNGIIFALFCISGWLLIRYTFREIKRREELEKISRAKSEFISITSHQLRTPLTAIKGYISMILEGTYGEVSERIKKVLENVFKANERMIKLTNAFLDVSKIELGTLELKKEPSQIENLISEVISEIEIEAKSKNLYLEFEKPKVPLPKILIDREKIKEVLSNLIDNAVKYTPKGGVKIQCKMANSRAIIVEVRDTGAGMTKEEISRLFESFSRGSAGQRFWTEGAGLGLYVAKKIVELHKGKIWAESAGKGKGSTFFVELPIT